MKQILLTVFLTAIFASGTLAQSVMMMFPASGDAGGDPPPVYSMDSLWQFGKMNKPELLWNDDQDAYLLCTDTSNYIQDTGRWEMYFGVSRDTLDFINNCLVTTGITSYSAKFQGIADSTGVLIEVSPDNIHWYNLLDQEDETAYIEQTGFNTNFDNGYWVNPIATLDGELVWGPGSNWIEGFGVDLVHAWTLQDAGSVTELHLRLTYISKTTTPHAGIAFASAQIFFAVWCEGIGIDETRGELQAKLYPNPVTECSKFELPDNTQYPVQLTIMDPNGRILHRQTVQEAKTIPFPRINLGEGIYMYSLVDAGKKFLSGKLIFEQ